MGKFPDLTPTWYLPAHAQAGTDHEFCPGYHVPAQVLPGQTLADRTLRCSVCGWECDSERGKEVLVAEPYTTASRPKPELLSRPVGTQPIRCPSCGHRLDHHLYLPGKGRMGCVGGCGCEWTPNDIAWWAVYGILTTPVPGIPVDIAPRDTLAVPTEDGGTYDPRHAEQPKRRRTWLPWG